MSRNNVRRRGTAAAADQLRYYFGGEARRRRQTRNNSTRRRGTVAAADRCRISKTAARHGAAAADRTITKTAARHEAAGADRWQWIKRRRGASGGDRPFTRMFGGVARRRRTPFFFFGLAGELHPDRTNAKKHRCPFQTVPNGFRYSTTKTGMKIPGARWYTPSTIFSIIPVFVVL